MLTDDGKHLYVSWDEYHMLIERLALKIDASGWEFDQILCLARGGMRPGDVLSRVFDKPLAIMSTSSYRAEAGTIQGRLDMAKYITMPQGRARRPRAAGRRPGRFGHHAARRRRPAARHAVDQRAALGGASGPRACRRYTPDYYVELLPTSPWIHQPFEEYDDLRPDGLAKKFVDLMPDSQRAARHRHKSPPKRAHVHCISSVIWCPGRDSNPHGVTR